MGSSLALCVGSVILEWEEGRAFHPMAGNVKDSASAEKRRREGVEIWILSTACQPLLGVLQQLVVAWTNLASEDTLSTHPQPGVVIGLGSAYQNSWAPGISHGVNTQARPFRVLS